MLQGSVVWEEGDLGKKAKHDSYFYDIIHLERKKFVSVRS